MVISTKNKFALLEKTEDTENAIPMSLEKTAKVPCKGDAAKVDNKKSSSSKTIVVPQKKEPVSKEPTFAKSDPSIKEAESIKKKRNSREDTGQKPSREAASKVIEPRTNESMHVSKDEDKQKPISEDLSDDKRATVNDKEEGAACDLDKTKEAEKEEEKQVITFDEWKAQQKKVDEPQFNIRKAGEGCADKSALEKLVPMKRDDANEPEHARATEKEANLEKKKQRGKPVSIDFKFTVDKPAFPRRGGDSGNRGRPYHSGSNEARSKDAEDGNTEQGSRRGGNIRGGGGGYPARRGAMNSSGRGGDGYPARGGAMNSSGRGGDGYPARGGANNYSGRGGGGYPTRGGAVSSSGRGGGNAGNSQADAEQQSYVQDTPAISSGNTADGGW